MKLLAGWQRSLKERRSIYGGLFSMMLLLVLVAACAPGVAAPPAQSTAAPVAQPTTAPAATTAAQGSPASLMVSENAELGKFLVDDKGMTLYLYTKDTPNTSNCYDKCAENWPPLYTTGAAVAGAGIDASLIGTTTRKDGQVQVTYKGWPLYYWVKDQKAGDTTGQWVGGVWFVISPAGEMIDAGKPPATAVPAATAAPAAGATAPSVAQGAAASLMASENAELGKFLVDDKGMTLYLYTKDTPNTSNCYDKCAENWPPLYTTGAAVAGTGIDASLIGTTTRKDGQVQVTYKGWPLYYWVKDQKAGDTTGQWVGGVWFVISPSGEMIKAGQPPATAVPTAAASGSDDYGKDDKSGGTPAPAAAGQSAHIDIENFVYDPKTLTVAVGTTVQWENKDAAPHTVTADDGSFDSGNMARDAEFSFTFTKAGTYNYYCVYHGGPGLKGMAAQIIVQ